MEEFRIVLADACKIVKESSRKRVISGADEDGRVMVEFSEPVGGRRVKMLTPDEINGMLYKEETPESPANAEEAMAEETEPPTAGQEESGESALERIPKDAQTGEPQYTQTDADTAWDAIVEQTEGDEDMARSVVDSTVRDKEAALKKLESSNPKPGATVAEKIAAAKEHKAAIEAARQELEQWKAIAEVENRRTAEEKVVSSLPAVGNDTVEVQSQSEVGNSMSGNSSEATSSTDKVSESSKTKQGKDAETDVKLSDEIDENGKPLVLAKDGTTTFGIMEPESGLREAPIQLSLGENYVGEDGKNHGYGLLHIEAGHGKQIRSAGFPSVEEFVEEVAKNYVDIREGAKIGNTQTYLLEMTDDHNNTLFVQLSKDGTYWNVNSAGIFNVKYSRRKPKVYSVPALGEDINTDTSEVDSDHSEGVAAPAGNSSKTSASKVSESPETKQEKAEKSISAKVKEASADVNTEPTEAQKEAGNYKKGHVQVGAFDITIEQPEGSIRRGTDANGKQWESKMHNTYGYFRGTEGVDGDHIDVFLSNDMDGWNGAQVFVVDQYNPDGTFDEHKVMLGFNDASDAKNNYLANYKQGWENGRRIDITGVNLEDFEKWIASSHRKTKPFSEYKSVKPVDDSETFKGHKVENSGKDTEAQIKHLEEIKDYPGADKKIVQSEIDRLKAKEEAKAKSKNVQGTNKTGAFGTIYTQFKGKAKEAIAFLLEKKEGEAVGALHHKDIGDIDLVWGNEKAGLQKIAKKHPEVLDNLQEIIGGMHVVSESPNRIKLESTTHFAVVSKEFLGKERGKWLLTAYEKKKDASGGSIDIAPEPKTGKQNGTAPLQDTVSTGKVSESPETKQEKKEKSEESKSKEENGVDDAKIDAVLEALSKGDEKAEQLVQRLTSRELSKLRSKVKASPLLENEWLHRVRTRDYISLHDRLLENQYVEPVKRVSGTFKMTDYIAPKNVHEGRLSGVYHDDKGYAVASDGIILVADKGSYDPKLKGKVIGKDGAAMENKFPNWQGVIPVAEKTKSSLIDVEDLHRFVAGVLKADKHAYISLRFPDGTTVAFNADRLNLMLRAMKRLGADKLLYTKDDMILVAKSDKGAALLMGRVYAEDDSMEEHGYAYPGNTVSMGKVSESPETKQEKKEKSEEDRQNKIIDVGEKISGARKDLLRDFSNKLKDTTLESLITLPFSKAFKRPDLKTAVEQGLLRQRDARFAEAVMATYLSKNKPRLLSGWKKGVSQKNLEAWAKDAYFGVQTLRALFEADETTRDKLIDEILSAKAYREDDIDRRKKQLEEWNPGKKFEGKCYPLNPVAVYMAVYERLGYDNIGEFKLPVSGVGSSTFFDHYELTDNSGKKIYPTRALQSFEDVVDEITYLSKVKNADKDTDHPNSIFRLAGINPIWESTGWRVLTLGTSSSKRPETHLFKTKEEAEKFAEEYKAGGKYRQASTPIENKELIGYGNYELKFHLGEKDISTGLTFSSKEDARAAIDTEHEKLNAIVNEKLAKARESGGNNEKRPLKDYVRIQAYTEDGKAWKYAVVLDERYAPKSTAFNTLPYSLANGFSTRKEAVAYIEKHRAEWDAKIDDINRRRKDFVFLNGSSERVGEDYRKGEDITAEQFREQFGFRGVQFGNWTNQKDRQAALNNAFDSFMDLAKILGISPKAVSLNGELGIAFGARGGGGAKAHYEREEVVINLTKTMGAGSLAHEWWHALDNYFARRGNVKLGMITEGKGIAMRGELRKAYDKLVSDTENSDYHRRSRDVGASYWGTRREETARMFAMWVFDEISKKGERNSFLTDNDPAAEERYAKGNYDFYVLMCGQDRPPMTFEEFRKSPSALAGYVYPSQQELEEFGADLRKIFDTVQERVDEETGNTVLYHRGEVVSEMSQEERVLRDAVIERLRESGMEVITDEEAGQRALDEANGKAKLSAKKRRALETASLGKTPRSLTVVSSADGANVLKSIDALVSEFEKSAVQPKTFIGDVAKALGAERGGSASEYASFETKNGKIITLRLSNHPARVSNFDANGETDGISSVVSPKKSEGMTNDGKAHVVEYYYDAIKLRRAEGKPLADIVRSIKQALYSGEFEDTTGLAERQEVNAEITDRVRFFRTAKGEAYGFTVGGKIYIDPKIANTETPIHEYAHLWAAALRGQNPKEWQNIVELMKGTSVWDEVKKRYPELNTDDDIADEVLATYSGRRGAERLREEQRKIAGDKGGVFEKAEAISALERVKQALRKFWKSVADFLHIHYKSAEEVADRVMKDLLNGVDPRKHFNSRNDDPRFMFAGEKGAARADRVMKDLFDDEGKNMRMESRDTDKEEVNIVEATHEHGFKNYADAKQWAKENIAGTYTDAETGGKGEIRISNTAIDKFLSESVTAKSENQDAHMSTLRVLPDVIRESIDAEQHPDFKKGVDGKRSAENGVNSDVMIHRLYGAIRIGDDIYRVKVTLKENRRTKETTKAYSYETTKIELLAGQHGDVTMTSPRNSNNSISVANLLKGVEKSDGSGKILSEDNSEENKIIAEAKKNGRYMLAPNGKKSNLNERQWAQVRTKAFKNWFGDWESDSESSSKVVDENREPLVVDGLFLNLKESPLPKMKKAFLRAKELAEMGRKAEKDSGYQRNSTSFAYSEEGDAFLEEYMHSSDSVQALCDCLMDGYTPKPVVAFRYGEIRENQRSYNYRDNILEKGVSVVGKVSEMNTKKSGYYDAFFGGSDYNIVIGYDINESGADGEMLLTKANVIGKAKDIARIVKSATENSGKFSNEEDDIRYRTGEKKELRDGRKIEFVRKPTATYNALARHLQAEGIKPDMHEARTGSRYMSFEKDGVQWEVRSSDHTKPEYYGEAQKPVELTYYKDKQGEENLSVSVDLGTSGYNIESMKALMAEIDRLKNDAGEVKESFDKGVVSDEAAKRYPLLSQALGVKSENEVRAKEEAREHAEEARKQEMRSAVEDMAGKLHLNNVDIVDKPAGRGAGRRERAKGMFERSTGRITINTGNCADKRDAVVTLLHEAVAHHGLRKLFGENFETFLDNVYNSANAEIRRIIDKHSRRYGGDKRTATEEYMASLAERTDFENAKKSGWWQRIKDFFLKMLEKIGLKGFKGEDLSDNELRYVLWRSYENLKSGGKDTVISAADDLAKQSELKVGEFAPDAKAEGSVAALNTRFNNELQQQIDGNLPSNHIYQMGNPGKILLSTGVPDLPIQMKASRLKAKATSFGHDFNLGEVKNLVKALQEPLAVFVYGDKTKAQNIIVPLQKGGKNFIVGLSLNPTVGGRSLEINSIRNVFPKNNSEWLNWISQGKALYMDKEKIQALIDQQRTILADVEYLDLDSAAKIVENFENPKPESKNDILFRDGAAKDYEKAQARETYERRVSTGMFQSREAIQDSMLSLKVAMDAIEEATAGKAKRIEDYDGFENAYLGENRLSSVNQAESAAFAHLLIRPMMEEVNRLAPTAKDRAELIDYMFAKHGLERNAYMRQQAAEKKLAEYKKQNPGTAKTAADFIDAERDYAGLTTLTGEADVSAAEAEAQRMVAEYENDYTFHGTWNEIYVCRKKIC